MRALLLLNVVVALCLLTSYASDLILGTSNNNRLIWQQNVKYKANQFVKKEEEVFYSDPEQRIIKGIIARDLDQTKASASIISGGVGYSFCSIHLKSVRGGGLNYRIEIYV